MQAKMNQALWESNALDFNGFMVTYLIEKEQLLESLLLEQNIGKKQLAKINAKIDSLEGVREITQQISGVYLSRTEQKEERPRKTQVCLIFSRLAGIFKYLDLKDLEMEGNCLEGCQKKMVKLSGESYCIQWGC